MVRKANINDIEAVTAIYEHIQKMEADGLIRIGWNPSTYPVRATAEEPYCALSTDPTVHFFKSLRCHRLRFPAPSNTLQTPRRQSMR